MTTPTPAPAASDGKTLGVVGVVLAILIPLVGLIVSIVARGQSKRAGVPNGAATAGIVISIILMVIGIIVAVIVAVAGASIFGEAAQVCATYGPGVWEVEGVTYTCG